VITKIDAMNRNRFGKTAIDAGPVRTDSAGVI
jgi:hypothetical protein